jgi:hypothetical protein
LRVYLGAPIDTTHSFPAQNFTDLLKICNDAVKEFNREIVAYNPLTAFGCTSRTVHDAKYVVDVNTNALINSDVGLFVVDDNPSFGVPVEIFMAAERRLEVIVWWRSAKSVGLYLTSMISARFMICTTEEQVMDALLWAGQPKSLMEKSDKRHAVESGKLREVKNNVTELRPE